MTIRRVKLLWQVMNSQADTLVKKVVAYAIDAKTPWTIEVTGQMRQWIDEPEVWYVNKYDLRHIIAQIKVADTKKQMNRLATKTPTTTELFRSLYTDPQAPTMAKYVQLNTHRIQAISDIHIMRAMASPLLADKEARYKTAHMSCRLQRRQLTSWTTVRDST